jgi:NitT/TauT family transport system substrate-binding protein
MYRSTTWLGSVLLVAVAAWSLPTATAAEISQLNIARAFGIAYLPMMIMERDKLIEKHVRAAGMGDLSVNWVTFGSGGALNDALLSGSVQIAVGGVPSMITLWARTRDSVGIRGVAAMSSIPMYLNSRNPSVKTIADFGPNDRIALPGVKISVHAVTLEMAAAKAFGKDAYAKLDPITVTLAHPEGVAALTSGISEITAHFTSPPFQNEELARPGIRRVLDSYDVLGGPHTFSAVWTTGKFRSESPKVYRAFYDALKEAIERIARDKRGAAEIYLQVSKDKMTVDQVLKLVDDPGTRFTTTPEKTMQYAEFMYSIGSIKVKPESWRDYFFPEVYDQPGS